MTRSIASISVGLALTIAGGRSCRSAGDAGSGSPLPGTGDLTKISSSNRESNAAYNQLIGAARFDAADRRKPAHGARGGGCCDRR